MNARPSTLGAHASGRRAGQRFDAEHGVVTEALLFLGDLDPEAIGPVIAHATHYEPTPVGDLERLLAHVPFPLEDAAFVDLGAGMGRALFAAARSPFRQIVGVEISPALVEVARDNLKAFEKDGLRCRDIRLVRGDAAAYRFPKGDLVVYLYNPFDATLVGRVVAALARQPRANLALLYHTPAERAVIDAHPSFELLAEEPFGLAYLGTPQAATP
jgi:SAM-dependent methyltransferase